MSCISQLSHRIYMRAWLQRGLTSWATVSQRSTAWISWLAKKVCSTILTQNQRSETKKPTKKQARIKSSASKITETFLVHRGTYWLTCCLEGVNHCHFSNLDTEKIVTCTSQQVPNEETHHLSTWLMTLPIHLMLGVTGKVQLWSSPPTSPQFRLGLIKLHTCSWPWIVT